MASPTPIYRVSFNGSLIPGYVQTETRPLSFRSSSQSILNRNGGLMSQNGADIRKIQVDLHILSQLSTYASGLDHLNDCKSQYRTALSILARAGENAASLSIGDMDRYTLAVVDNVSAPFEAGQSRMIAYSIVFSAEPYFRASVAKTTTFSGNGTASLTLGDTATTYPTFTVPSGVTAFTATHAASGRVVDFVRGSFGSTITINCANFQVTQNGIDASSTMNNVNYGIKHTTGAGTFSVAITNFAGSGSVTMSVKERYEL